MSLRQSTDRAAIDALQRLCLPSDEPLSIEEGGVWWITTDLTAFCAIKQTDTEGHWYLSRAGVVPSARGQGLQKRMIRCREQFAKKMGAAYVITDCTAENLASANSLMACGYRLYAPQYRWALPNSLYWRKKL
jgi:RimJ/RimL family protein N-acetyltransferase